MIDIEKLITYLPKKGISFKELSNSKECAIYTSYDGFYKYDWKPLRDYVKSIDYELLFILNH